MEISNNSYRNWNFQHPKIVKLMMVNKALKLDSRFVLHATLICSKSHYLSVEPIHATTEQTDNTNDIHERIMLMSAT